MVTLPRRRNGAAQSSADSNQISLASAKEIWAQALRLHPPSPSQSFVKLQRLLCRLQDLHEPVLTKSETSYLHVNVGLLLAYLGETALAVQSFQQAVEFDKYSAIAWHALGGMAFLLGMWLEAGEAWTQCWHCFGSQQQSIIYHMCKIGGGCASSEIKNREREWELRKSRVEWNMRFAYSDDGWQREYMQERLWSINGVPSGLLFGPSLSIDCSYFDSRQGHSGAASANILQHNSTGTREMNRTTPKCVSYFTKPLPHLPSVADSAMLLIHRPQKIFLPRWSLFKARALSPDKSKSHQHKRPDHSTAPPLTGDLMTPYHVLRRPARDPPATKIGGLFSSKYKFFEPLKSRVPTCDSHVENTFPTDSEFESDEEGYYFPKRPVPKLDVQPFYANPVPGACDRACSPASTIPSNIGQVEISSPITRKKSPNAQNEVRKPIQIDTIVEDEEWNIVATSYSHPSAGACDRACSPASTIPSNFGQVEISSPITRTKSPNAQNEVRKPIQIDTIVEDEEWNIVATSYSHPSAASTGSFSPPPYPLRSSSILYLLRGQQPDPNMEIEVPKSDPPKCVSPHAQQDAKPQVPARKLNRIENIILGTRRQDSRTQESARTPNRIEKILLEKRNQNSPVQTVSQMPRRVCASFEENEPSLSASGNTRERHRSETSIAESMTMEITVMLDQSCCESCKPEGEAAEGSESRGRSEKRQKPTEREPAKLIPVEPERSKSKPAKSKPAKPVSAKPGPAKPEPVKPKPLNSKSAKPEPAKPEPAEPEPGPVEPEPEPAKRELTKSKLEEPQAPSSKPVQMEPTARGIVKSKIAKWEESVKVDATKMEPKLSSLGAARPATSQSPNIQPATIQPPTIQPETTQSVIQPKTAEPATAQQAKATLQKTQPKKKAALMKPSVPEAGVELLNQVRFEGFAGEWRALDLIYEAEQKLKESQTWNSETSKRVRFEYSSSGWRALDPECRPSRE